MRKFTINLNNIDTIKTFINIMSKLECDTEICSGKYIINAKSIMGVFSIDVSKPVTLVVHTEDAHIVTDLKKQLCDMRILVCEEFAEEE